MATIASLNVILSATTAAFEKGISRAGKMLKGLNPMSVLTGAAAGFTAANIFDTFTSSVGNAIARLDELGNVADQIGVSTNALAGLHHAADMADVETASLNAGMVKLAKTLTAATGGGKEAKSAFESLGLSANYLAGIGLDRSFMAVADAISQIEDPLQRIAAAQAIFGKSGADLLNLLSLGAEGLEEMREEAVRFGLAMGDDAVAAIARADDALTRMEKSLNGLGNRIAVEMAPGIAALAELGSQVIATTSLSDFLSHPGKLLSNTSLALQDPATLMKMFGVGDRIAQHMGGAGGGGGAAGGSSDLIEGLKREASTFGLSADRVKLYEAALDGASQQELVQAAAIVTHIEQMESWAKQSKDATTARERLTESSNELIRDLEEEVAFFHMSADWARISKLQYDGASQAVIQHASALQVQLDAMEKAKEAQKEAADEAKKNARELAEANKRAAEQMKEAWTDFADGVKKDARSPLEEFLGTIGDLKTAFGKGLISLEQGEMAGFGAFKDLQDSLGIGEDTRPQALIRGSAEAFSAITRNNNKPTVDQILKIAQEMLALERQKAHQFNLELTEVTMQ